MIDENVVYKIKDYLKARGIVDIDDEVKHKSTKMDQRVAGTVFSFSDHLQGVIYSLLSAQTVWANVERNLRLHQFVWVSSSLGYTPYPCSA